MNVRPFLATSRPPAGVPIGTVQGTLALDAIPRRDTPVLKPPTQGVAGGDVVPIDRAHRREVERWAHRYAQAVVEIVGGDRPVTQVLRWTTPEVYANLARRAHLVARAGSRPAQVATRALVRPQVMGVRTCFLASGLVEVSVHVRYGERSRAIAARLEHRAGRWQCSALEFA